MLINFQCNINWLFRNLPETSVIVYISTFKWELSNCIYIKIQKHTSSLIWRKKLHWRSLNGYNKENTDRTQWRIKEYLITEVFIFVIIRQKVVLALSLDWFLESVENFFPRTVGFQEISNNFSICKYLLFIIPNYS